MALSLLFVVVLPVSFIVACRIVEFVEDGVPFSRLIGNRLAELIVYEISELCLRLHNYNPPCMTIFEVALNTQWVSEWSVYSLLNFCLLDFVQNCRFCRIFLCKVHTSQENFEKITLFNKKRSLE